MSELFRDMMEGLDSIEAYMNGEREGFVVHAPSEIDVKKIRKDLKMTQAGFCRTFGFSLDTVKHWESRRRTPSAASRAFLKVIAHSPAVVLEALGSESPAPSRKVQPSERSR
jgi:putative transcriptional regulator